MGAGIQPHQDFGTLLPLLLGLGGAAAGFMPSPTSTSSSGSGTTDSFSSGNTDASSASQLLNLLNSLQQISGQTQQHTTPNLNPQSQEFINKLMSQYGSLQPTDLSGYQASQTSAINRNADLQQQAVQNIMASRGLATSPAAGTSAAGVEAGRFQNITQLNQQIPLLQHQMTLQNLSGASSLAGLLPSLSGSTTTGATNQNTSNAQQQNQFNTAQGQTATNTTGQQSNVQQQQQQQKSGGGIGGAISGGLSALLPLLLFSDERLKKDIKPIDKAISKLKELKPAAWTWKGGETKDMGFIAQDIEKILPELVHSDSSKGVNLKKVNYAGLIPLLVSAVQDLDSRVGG